MKSFYEMVALMEQAASASVERFPQDFEQVLNFMTGGSWTLVSDEYSPFDGMGVDRESRKGYWFIRTKYRGMSESGRHYEAVVHLVNIPDPPINQDGAKRFKKWRQEFVSYDPKGSKMVYFELVDLYELGPGMGGGFRPEKRDHEGEELTAQQKTTRSLIDRLARVRYELERDDPRPRLPPSRRVIRWGDHNRHSRPVDLAKHIRDEITNHERKEIRW